VLFVTSVAEGVVGRHDLRVIAGLTFWPFDHGSGAADITAVTPTVHTFMH
jgi:hypothetical protein